MSCIINEHEGTLRAGKSYRASGVCAMPHDAHVCAWGTISEMRCLQLCDSRDTIIDCPGAATAEVCMPDLSCRACVVVSICASR